MRETCSLCGLTQGRGLMRLSLDGDRWLCGDYAACSDRFLAWGSARSRERAAMELGA